MNNEEIMKTTMLNLQDMLCKEHGIDQTYTKFQTRYDDLVRKGWSDSDAWEQAYRDCEKERNNVIWLTGGQ